MGKKTYFGTGLSFANCEDITKAITDIAKSTPNALNTATKETAKRAKPKIKKAVTTIYGISSTDMKSENDKAKIVKDGKIKIGKYKVNSWSIQYDGRTLTPLHFKMSPTSRPDKPKYLIKATIKKGQRKAFKRRPAFIAPSFTESGSTQIPFYRYKGDMITPKRGRYVGRVNSRTGKRIKRERVKPIKTTSIPQMVSNKDVEKLYIPPIQELLMDRVEHQLERQMKKCQRSVGKLK